MICKISLKIKLLRLSQHFSTSNELKVYQNAMATGDTQLLLVCCKYKQDYNLTLETFIRTNYLVTTPQAVILSNSAQV